ncbi:MAG: hypothetical protein BWZ10_02164 [candidate division BRC1 bacterium ADurb.BinA364]|nr:MAG: hypothetical protein BWZ10_02164 [candidate division BRC1 bacterium ADurb.BinA364]
MFDFCDAQYFSWVRANRLLVRGERGELVDRTLYWLPDFRMPMEAELRRMDAGDYGNLEGYYHKGIIAGEQWVYENPYAPARLSDDEIAVAALMDKMAAHCQGGPSFYSLAEGAQDQYLTLKITEALKAGAPVKTERQPWAE